MSASTHGLVPLRALLRRVETGRSFGGAAPPAADDEWGVIKVSAMTWGTFRAHENKRAAVGEVNIAHEIRPGDLLLSRANTTAYVGATVLVGDVRPHLLLSDKSLRLVPRGDVDARWLQAMLSSPDVRRRISAMASGTKDSMRNISQANLLGIQVPVVPPGEQRRIVDVLEDHLSRLDAADAYLSAARRRLRNTVAAVLHHALPVDSPSRPLTEVLALPLSNGRSVPTAGSEGFPVLRLTAIGRHRIDTSARKLGMWTQHDASRFLVAEGDFLLARGNGSRHLVGRGALVRDVPDPVAFPDTMIRARLDPDTVDPEYFSLVWSSPGVRRQVEGSARTTAGIFKVNQKDLGRVRLPVPALSIQRDVARRVQDLSDSADRAEAAVLSGRRRAEHLRRALLHAAFAGRLTGRSSDTEVVEDLASV